MQAAKIADLRVVDQQLRMETRCPSIIKTISCVLRFPPGRSNRRAPVPHSSVERAMEHALKYFGHLTRLTQAHAGTDG